MIQANYWYSFELSKRTSTKKVKGKSYNIVTFGSEKPLLKDAEKVCTQIFLNELQFLTENNG